MPLFIRNDEQIQVGVTPGLDAGTTSFTFDGTLGKPDYRGYEIVISEYTGRSPMMRGLDYSWDLVTGNFQLLLLNEIFAYAQYYNVHFQITSLTPVPVTPTSLIDTSYFIRNIRIPNIDPLKPTNAVTYNALVSYIIKYEPECLRNILGYELYNALITQSSQRITDLIYGLDYVDYKGVPRRWRGLVQPTEKISLIANYIYYYFQESYTTQTSGNGTNVPVQEAALSVSPGDKMINAWLFFSLECRELVYFLWNSNYVLPKIYPEFTDRQLCYTQEFSRSNTSPF